MTDKPQFDPANEGQKGDEERVHAQEPAEGSVTKGKPAPDVREHSQKPAEGDDPADPTA